MDVAVEASAEVTAAAVNAAAAAIMLEHPFNIIAGDYFCYYL